MKRKIFSLFLSLVFILSSLTIFSSCGKNDERLQISCTMFDAESIGNDEMWSYLENKFNVEFKFIPITDDDYEEKTNLLIATNQMPDLMWLDLDESNFSGYANWVSQGCFSPMPSLEELEATYPNIYAQYSLDVNAGDELMTIDGIQYAHPCIRDNPDKAFLSGMGWMYRRDWAKKLGLYKENDLYTWSEWIELCRAFMTNDPGENGNKNIGMGTASYYFPMAFGVYQTSSEYGFGSFTLENGEYKWTASQKETIEGLLIAKSLWDEGLIWKDNYLGDSPDSYYTSGLMGMIFQNFTLSRYNNFLEAVKDSLPNENPEDVCALAKVIGPDGTLWAKQSQCYYGAVVMSSNIKPEVKDKWLSILDWLVSDEGSLFIQYGIEGIDYKIENDAVTCLWPYSEEGNVQIDPYPSGSRLFYECYVGAVNNKIAPPVSYLESVIKTVDEQYNFMTQNAYIRRFDYKSSYISPPAKDEYSTIQSDTENKMMELIVNGSAVTLASEWESWVNSKNSMVAPILDELNSMITDKPEEHSIKLAK